MASPLPPGVRFWIAAPRGPGQGVRPPRFAVEVDGTAIALGDVAGKLLMHLLTEPGRRWTTRDLAAALYGDDEDGGPLAAERCVLALLTKLRRTLRRGGVALEMADLPSGHRLSGLRPLPGAVPQVPPPVPPVALRKSRIALADARRAAPVRDHGRYVESTRCPSPSAPWAFPERVESRNTARAVGRGPRGRYPTDDAVPN